MVYQPEEVLASRYRRIGPDAGGELICWPLLHVPKVEGLGGVREQVLSNASVVRDVRQEEDIG
jgi:hypothetical protein